MTELTPVHMLFDILAAFAAIAGALATGRFLFRQNLLQTADRIGTGYFPALSLGSIAGAFTLGTLNLYLSGIPAAGRSILGALAGAILAVECYKRVRGIAGSTGYMFVVPFCLCVIIGRIGCFLSGINDNTYGIPTTLPWGHDFGDHIMRHPVQLYESLSMALFLMLFLAVAAVRRDAAARGGFYLCAGFYAAQRFAWEFLKPYAAVAGPLNLFQYVCLILIAYSLGMTCHAYARRTA